MAGAGRNHASITPVLAALCVGQLRGKPCRYRDTDTKVVVVETGSTYYPDGLIACPPNYVNESAGAIDNPAVIFEVLSPSTWRFDREAKFDSYARLESLREYVLIHADTPRVEVFTRREDGKWVLGVYLGGTTAPIDCVGIALALDELYEEAVFEAS
jgi:Uma2 family endonuclease